MMWKILIESLWFVNVFFKSFHNSFLFCICEATKTERESIGQEASNRSRCRFHIWHAINIFFCEKKLIHTIFSRSNQISYHDRTLWISRRWQTSSWLKLERSFKKNLHGVSRFWYYECHIHKWNLYVLIYTGKNGNWVQERSRYTIWN